MYEEAAVKAAGTNVYHHLHSGFLNPDDPKEMEAAYKAGMLDKYSTLVGEVARMATRIVLE